MVAYSHLRRRRGRTGHGPEIPSGVRCLGRDSYPRGAVVGAVINVDGVAAGVLSAPVDVLVLPDRPRFSAVGPEESDVRRGRSTARRSARLRYSEESEVVSAGGQRVAIRIGQIGVEEESSDSFRSPSAPSRQTRNFFPGGSDFGLRSTPFTERASLGRCPRHRPQSPGRKPSSGRRRSRRRDGADSSTCPRGGHRAGVGDGETGIVPVAASNSANVFRVTLPILKVPLAAGSPATWSNHHRSAVRKVVLTRRGDPDRCGIADSLDGVVKGIPVGRTAGPEYESETFFTGP